MLRKKEKKTLLHWLICFITKKGKKRLAQIALKKALIDVSREVALGSQFVLAVVFKKLRVSVEVKDVQRRRKYLKVPFFISKKRQNYLSAKWFFQAVQANKASLTFSAKIAAEMLSILKVKQAKSVLLRNQNIKLALANRSNIHFRW